MKAAHYGRNEARPYTMIPPEALAALSLNPDFDPMHLDLIARPTALPSNVWKA
jgi:hypothetical protein